MPSQPLYQRQGKWGSERLSNLLRITLLIGDDQDRLSGSGGCLLNTPTMPLLL